MLDRRQLLRRGLAASVLSGFPLRALPLEAGRRVDLAIIDSGLSGATEMTVRLQHLADHREAFLRDPGLLWMRRIEPLIRSAPVVLAGYTSAPTLFCLHYLARHNGLVLRGFGAGPRPPELIFRNAESELVDLRELPSHDQCCGFTWLLGPREE